MSCLGCTDPNKEFNLELKSAYVTAKKMAEDANEAIAICRNWPEWSIFYRPAQEAIQRGLFIIDIISGLPRADAGQVY